MTSAKKKAERIAAAIAKANSLAEEAAKAASLENTIQAGRALRGDDEQEFRRLFPACDVGLRFIYRRLLDGGEVESDLFASACYGIMNRKKDDLARLVVERMIMEGIDLRTHRTNQMGFTTLMMAATHCSKELLEFLLPRSDVNATTTDGQSAAQLAREIGRIENANYIEAYLLSEKEAEVMFDDIPIPRPRKRKSIDDRPEPNEASH